MKRYSEQIHYALYAAIILGVVVLHADKPIAGTNSKLTIVLMSLLILGEALARMVRAAKAQS